MKSWARRSAAEDDGACHVDAPLLNGACLNVSVAVLVYLHPIPASAFQPGLTRTWILLPITAFFMITISRLTYYYAIRRIGPSRTIPIAASTPAVTALLATIFLGEPFTILIILGLLCLILGLNLVVRSAPAQPNLEMGHTRKDVVKGYISAGLTTLNWSVSGVMVRTITLDMNALAASALLIWIGLGFAWVLAVGFAHRETADENPPGELEMDAHGRRLPDDSGALVQQRHGAHLRGGRHLHHVGPAAPGHNGFAPVPEGEREHHGQARPGRGDDGAGDDPDPDPPLGGVALDTLSGAFATTAEKRASVLTKVKSPSRHR